MKSLRRSPDVYEESGDGSRVKIWPPCKESSGSFSSDPELDAASGQTKFEDLDKANAEIERLRAALDGKSERLQPLRERAGSSEFKAAGRKRMSDTLYTGPKGGGFVISGGNFDGEYPAKVPFFFFFSADLLILLELIFFCFLDDKPIYRSWTILRSESEN